MSDVPPLANGMPRVDWDESMAKGNRLSAIITEDEPIFLMAGDSGLELVFEPQNGAEGFPWSGIVRAKRRGPPPQIVEGELP